MTGKIIRILFITLLLGVNTLIYYIYFQPNKPKHLAYIPEDAVMVFTVNTKEISGKLAYTALFNEEEFSELLEGEEESDIDWAENVNNGLNFFGRITMMLIPDPDSIIPFSCMMLDIASESQFRKFLEKKEAAFEDLEGGITYAELESGSFVYNEEVAVIFNGGYHPNDWKKIGSEILMKKNPIKHFSEDENNLNKDFMMSVSPGIEKMDEAPALKGMMGSFIHKLIFSGEFKDEFVGMNYELVTDSTLLNDASAVFEKHEFKNEIPEELQEGIFNFHMTFNPEKWVEWMEKGNFLSIPDSVSKSIYSGLKQSLDQHFVLQVAGVRLMRIDLDSTKNGMKTFPIPDFKAAFSLRDSKPVQLVFDQLVLDSVMTKTEDVYLYTSPFQLQYKFKLSNESLSLSTTDEFILDPKNHFHGFSNWFYFNAENYIESIPGDNPIGFTVREVMQMVNSIHYGYGYSTSTKGNHLMWEGKMYYSEKKKNSLIETIKFIQKMAGLFVM